MAMYVAFTETLTPPLHNDRLPKLHVALGRSITASLLIEVSMLPRLSPLWHPRAPANKHTLVNETGKTCRTGNITMQRNKERIGQPQNS